MSSNRFTYSSRRNPCPICEDHKGKCRQTDEDLILCMSFANEDSGHRDYGFIKPSADGLWGIHAPRRNKSPDFDPAAHRKAIAHIREQREREQRDKHEAGLSVAERDREFRRLLGDLTLDDAHRQNLRGRGLSDEAIAAGMFRTVASGQSVACSHLLPGVKNGRLWFGQEGDRGILCPAWDADGRIIGAQIRRDNDDGGRYRWLAGAQSSHLQTGELPITIVTPANPAAIHLTEGILKPYVTAHRHNVATVGAAGGLFLASPEQFKDAIATLSERLGTKLIRFPVDSEGRSNEQVHKRDSATIRFLESLGYAVEVGDWGQWDDKTRPDIDELPSLDAVRWVTVAEYITPPAPSPIEWLDSLDGKLPTGFADVPALSAHAYQLGKHLEIKRGKIRAALDRFKAAYRRAINDRLTPLQVRGLDGATVGTVPRVELPTEHRLTLLNAQKGTCKTSQGLESLVAAAVAADQSVLIIVPSKSLSRAEAAVLNAVSHLDESEAARSRCVVTCPESLHKFMDRRWDVVLIDEVNEIVPRVLMGTLGRNPKESRAAFCEVLRDAKTVTIAQDGVYQPVLNAIARLGGFDLDNIEEIRRRRPPSSMTVKLYLSNLQRYGWLNGIIEDFAAGKRVSLPCGSREEGRRLSRFLRQRFPEKRITIVDGRDSFGSLRQAIASDFDGWLDANQPDLLIYTPVFNSGVSVESDYFDAQYEYVTTHETATSASQRGERVRAVLGGGKITERHVFIQRRGLADVPPSEVLTAEYWRGVLSCPDGQFDAAISAAKSLGRDDLEKAIRQGAIAPVDEFPELAELMAIHAREVYCKIECLTAEWESNGWTVTPGDSLHPVAAAELAEQMGWISEGIVATRAKTSAIAPSIAKGRVRSRILVKSWESGDEPEGPVSGAKFHRWDVEKLTGDHPFLTDPQWWAAFDIDDPHLLTALRRRVLALMPDDDFHLLQWWAALTTVGRSHPALSEAPPLLPATLKEIQAAALLRQCPHFRAVVAGEVPRWTQRDDMVRVVQGWTLANAQALTAMSRHEQRIHGLQFTPRTPAVKCLHRLLSMVGVTVVTTEREGQIRVYRPKQCEDAIAKMNGATDLQQRRLGREVYRLDKLAMVQDAIAQHIQKMMDGARQGWREFEELIRSVGIPAQSPVTELQLIDPPLTEVLSQPQPDPEPEPPPPEWNPPPSPPLANVWALLGEEWILCQQLAERVRLGGVKLWDGQQVRWTHHISPA